mmetsp:Transcript_31272/g.37217  ORF Transcript_31272/g.37217 Transcript_31272/m.37217 type:complete len:279 (-) Transcript_31272:540-1376(-)
MILQNSTDPPPRRTQRRIQHMHITRPRIKPILIFPLRPSSLLHTTTSLHTPRLIICTIGARYQFPIRILTREPSLQIILLHRRIVQLTTHNTNDTVRNTKALIKLLRALNHTLLFRLTLRKVIHGDAKLFNLFKLVHAENTTNVPPGRTGLLPKTGGNTPVPYGQRLLLDPIIHVIRTNRLFGGSNEVFLTFTLRIIRLTGDFVQLLVEILQLGEGGHNLLLHKVGWLEDIVSAFAEEGNGVVDDRLVEQYSSVFEEVAAVSGDVLSADGFVPVDSPE